MTIEELQAQKLEEIAADYERRGYEIHLRPAPDELPESLRALHPALVARSEKENVVVEVQPWVSRDFERWDRLDEAVRREDGWKLEFSFISHPVAPDVPSDEDLASDEQVDHLLSSAEAMFTRGETGSRRHAGMVGCGNASPTDRPLCSAGAGAAELRARAEGALLARPYRPGNIREEAVAAHALPQRHRAQVSAPHSRPSTARDPGRHSPLADSGIASHRKRPVRAFAARRRSADGHRGAPGSARTTLEIERST